MGYTFTNTAATTAAVTNRLVTTTNMANGAYALANTSAVWAGGFTITATITAVTGNDTPGTLAVVGTNLAGQAQTETITLSAGVGGSGTAIWKSVTSITQAGWVINVGNDTIVIGVGEGNYAVAGGGRLGGILVNNSIATAFTVADGARTIVTVPASVAAGTYYNLNGVDFSGYLKVSTTSTNNVTVFHTPTVPTYATT